MSGRWALACLLARLGTGDLAGASSGAASAATVGAMLEATPAALSSLAAAPKVTAANGPVRLVVLVVVDQMRGSELDCTHHPYQHGLARLCREGRSYRRATLAHGLTETASGHATLATGASPALHGVLDKQLFDRCRGTLRDVCAFDGETRGETLGEMHARPGLRPAGSCNARALRLPTLGERLRAAQPQARVVALGAKDRSANLLAGTDATLVAWSHGGSAGPELRARSPEGPNVPGWLQHAFASSPASGPFAGWQLADRGASEDAVPAQMACDCGHGPAFPHRLDAHASPKQRHDAWLASPQSDAAIVALASAARRHLRLGRGPAADLLLISLAATDRLGHCFGPAGPERRAVLASVDALVGTLLAQLREEVPEGLLVAVTADHGMMPRQDLAAAAERRIGTLSTAEAMELLTVALSPFAGGAEAQLAGLRYPFVFLQPGPQRAAAAAAVRSAFAAHPAVFRAWTAEELLQDMRPLGRRMAESYAPERGGDVVLALRPYHRPVEATLAPGQLPCGARHGSPWHYDRWVPLVLWGDGVEPGSLEEAVDVRQLSRSLADALQLTPALWAAPPLP